MSSLNILFLIYWVSLFPYLLTLWSFDCTFCFSVSVSRVTFLAFVSISSKNLPLITVEVSIIRAHSSFSKYWYLFSPVAYLSLHSYFPKVFISPFLHLLLVWFIVSIINVATAYIKLFISVYLIHDYYFILIFWRTHYISVFIRYNLRVLHCHLLIVDLLIVKIQLWSVTIFIF